MIATSSTATLKRNLGLSCFVGVHWEGGNTIPPLRQEGTHDESRLKQALEGKPFSWKFRSTIDCACRGSSWRTAFQISAGGWRGVLLLVAVAQEVEIPTLEGSQVIEGEFDLGPDPYPIPFDPRATFDKVSTILPPW